jgi:hypothetical protein
MDSTSIASTFGLLTEAEYAQLRAVEIKQIRLERWSGSGPAYVKLGKRVCYPVDAVKAYILQNTVTPTKAPTLTDGKRRGASAP